MRKAKPPRLLSFAAWRSQPRPEPAPLKFGLLGVLTAASLAFASCGGLSEVERFCQEVAELETADLQALDVSSTDDPGVRAEFQKISDKLDDVLAASPETVRSDVAVLAGLTAALETAVRSTNSREPFDRSAALLAAQAPFEQDLPGAIQRFNNYVTRNCTPAPS